VKLGFDLNAINHSVGQLEKGKHDIVGELSGVSWVHNNGHCGEALVESGLEGEGEGVTNHAVYRIIDYGSRWSRGNSSRGNYTRGEDDSLGLILGADQQVVAVIKYIRTVGAHALGAIEVAICRVTNTGAGLHRIPAFILERGSMFLDANRGIIIPGGGVSEVINVLASAVARAVIRAGAAVACLSFIAIKASAHTSRAIANALTSTLNIFVVSAGVVGSIHPREFVGAHAIRAVSGIMGKTNAPVIVTLADIIGRA